MKFVKVVFIAGLILFATSVARADGFDGHVLLGGGPGGSPSCSSFQGSTDSNGLINGDCTVTGETATTIRFAILDQNSNGGLGCSSSLTEAGWTVHLSTSGGVDICTVTAHPDGEESGKPLFKSREHHNDTSNDCDIDDFAQGIPVGCDITFTTDDPTKPFLGNKPFDVSANNSPLASLPEPGSLSLLLSGLTGLVFLRRKFAQ